MLSTYVYTHMHMHAHTHTHTHKFNYDLRPLGLNHIFSYPGAL